MKTLFILSIFSLAITVSSARAELSLGAQEALRPCVQDSNACAVEEEEAAVVAPNWGQAEIEREEQAFDDRINHGERDENGFVFE